MKASMTQLKPLETKNLDTQYGTPTLDWDQIEAVIAAVKAGPGRSWFLGTVRPDGRPHAAAIGHVWHEGAIYFTTHPTAQKTTNLLADPRCTIAAGLEDYDFVFEGAAARLRTRTRWRRSRRSIATWAGQPRRRETWSLRRTARRAPGAAPGTCTGSRCSPSSRPRWLSRAG